MKDRNVRIYCHSCNGVGYVEEKEYPHEKIVKVVCPECDGVGNVGDILYEEEPQKCAKYVRKDNRRNE